MKLLSYIPFSRTEFKTGLVLFTLTFLAVAGGRWFRLYNPQAIQADREVQVFVEEAINLSDLADLLTEEELIEDKQAFMWAGRLHGWNRFAKGHYLFEGHYSTDELLSKMARGIQDPVTVTIPPGSTEERIAARLVSELEFDSVAFAETIADSSFWEQQQLDRRDMIGWFYPNSYSFYWTSSPERVLERIFDEFRIRVVEPHRERMEELDISVNEIVTLASIIEWEANFDDEKAQISGLYWNRLNEGMYLQADPTINYALGERRRLLYSDYQMDHPYNTYTNLGLPPGPITNPGDGSIQAALYPDDHDYFYMVASPQGRHDFSRTFEEHREKSARWREWIREQYRIKEENERLNSERGNGVGEEAPDS